MAYYCYNVHCSLINNNLYYNYYHIFHPRHYCYYYYVCNAILMKCKASFFRRIGGTIRQSYQTISTNTTRPKKRSISPRAADGALTSAASSGLTGCRGEMTPPPLGRPRRALGAPASHARQPPPPSSRPIPLIWCVLLEAQAGRVATR